MSSITTRKVTKLTCNSNSQHRFKALRLNDFLLNRTTSNRATQKIQLNLGLTREVHNSENALVQLSRLEFDRIDDY